MSSFRTALSLVALASIGGCTVTVTPFGQPAAPVEQPVVQPFAHLESVVLENRLAVGSEIQGVQVTRGDVHLTTRVGMALQKGDSIVTDGAVEAVILFRDEYELILATDTEISILNPSIFMKIGKAVVKLKKKVEASLEELREKFRVETEYVNAGVEGTEFTISVDGENVVSLVVREGAVKVESRTQSWAPVTYRPRNAGTVRGNQKPTLRTNVPEREVSRAFQWARDVEAVTWPSAVPDLTGMPLDQAREELRRAGLQPGRIQQVEAEGEAVGTVLGQNLNPGERVRLGTPVDLRVAARTDVAMPDVRGMSLMEAGVVLSLAGLQVGQTSETEASEGRAGRIVHQSPPPGARVRRGSAVALVIAARRPPAGRSGRLG